MRHVITEVQGIEVSEDSSRDVATLGKASEESGAHGEGPSAEASESEQVGIVAAMCTAGAGPVLTDPEEDTQVPFAHYYLKGPLNLPSMLENHTCGCTRVSF